MTFPGLCASSAPVLDVGLTLEALLGLMLQVSRPTWKDEIPLHWLSVPGTVLSTLNPWSQ